MTKEDIEYLLRHLNQSLATPVSPGDIVSGFAGARPLVASGDERDTKKLARDDVIEVDPHSGLISIMGGKWTTHRAMAEDTIDRAQQALGAPQTDSRTRNYSAWRPGLFRRLLETAMPPVSISEKTAHHGWKIWDCSFGGSPGRRGRPCPYGADS